MLTILDTLTKILFNALAYLWDPQCVSHCFLIDEINVFLHPFLDPTSLKNYIYVLVCLYYNLCMSDIGFS